jgi:lysophospholipase L1-like esterase
VGRQADWDVLVIALGTNSFGGLDSAGKPETAARYAEKYHAFLSTIREKAPNKPILSMTPILNRFDLKPTKNKNGEMPQDYRNAITQVVRQRQASDRNLHLLDGLQLINDPLYLWVTDVVHPNDAGSQRMANGVAAALKPLLKTLPGAP